MEAEGLVHQEGPTSEEDPGYRLKLSLILFELEFELDFMIL